MNNEIFPSLLNWLYIIKDVNEYSDIRIPLEYSNTISEFEYSHFYLSLGCAF